MGPIAFVLVFLLVPLAAAVFAGGFFAVLALVRLMSHVPTGIWAALTVAAVVLLAARLGFVLRSLRRRDPVLGEP